MLVAVEMGMRNHELVPTPLIERIAGLRHGGVRKLLGNCLRHKLIRHDGRLYEGYYLTYPGYDLLALKSFVKRGVLHGAGRQIGVGKESDVFLCVDTNGTEIVLKLHRLGRTSFRAVRAKRDYLNQNRKKASNWLYMSRLSALKEFAFMKALFNEGFPVPQPLDCNRHAILMTKIEGYPLYQVQGLTNPQETMRQCISLIVRLAEYGLVHGDLNEFNLMVLIDSEDIVMIDFPQMISTSHLNAEEQFDRDINCIHTFFAKRFEMYSDYRPKLGDILVSSSLDVQLEASGFSREQQREFEEIQRERQGNKDEDGDDDDDDDENDEDVQDEISSNTSEDSQVHIEEEEEVAVVSGLREEDLRQLREEYDKVLKRDIGNDDDVEDDEDGQSVKSYVSNATSYLRRRKEVSEEEIKQRVKRQMSKRNTPNVMKLARRDRKSVV